MRGLLRLFAVTTVAVILFESSNSQTLEWTHTWGTAGDDQVMSVALGDDGAVYTCGLLSAMSNSSLLAKKYDAVGNLVWARTWDSAQYASGYGVAVAQDGSVYTVGTNNNQGIIIKWDASGNIVWQNAHSLMIACWDVAVDNSGEITVVGVTIGNTSVVTRLGDSGNVLWTKMWGGGVNGIEQPSVDVDATTGEVVVGGRGIGAQGTFEMLWFTASGSQIWSTTFDLPMSFNVARRGYVASLGSGGGYAAADVELSPGNAATAVVKVQHLGAGVGIRKWAQAWKAWNGVQSQFCRGVSTTPSGGALIAGVVGDALDSAGVFVAGYDTIDTVGALAWHRFWKDSTVDAWSCGLARNMTRAALSHATGDINGSWIIPPGIDQQLAGPGLVGFGPVASSFVGATTAVNGTAGSPSGAIDTFAGGRDTRVIAIALLGACTMLDPCLFEAQDVNCDGVISVLDVVKTIDAAFRGQAALPPCCQFE